MVSFAVLRGGLQCQQALVFFGFGEGRLLASLSVEFSRIQTTRTVNDERQVNRRGLPLVISNYAQSLNRWFGHVPRTERPQNRAPETLRQTTLA